jgi:hypothetical protein
MTPTLAGRLQTRVFILVTAGALWTAVITPLLPRPSVASLASAYRMTFEGLLIIGALGIGWELVYHALQQFRWDKDWPPLFVLLALAPEALLAWLALHALGWIPGTVRPDSPYRRMFAIDVVTTWLVVWLALQGPLRVVVIRWRHMGGRVIGHLSSAR